MIKFLNIPALFIFYIIVNFSTSAQVSDSIKSYSPGSIKTNEYDSTKTYVLETTTVTGTRLELKQNRLPQSISIINSTSIENSTEQNILPLVDAFVPGVFVNSRNILGYGVSSVSAGDISIRGLGESPNTGVLVLVDGQAQYMGLFGHPINDSYLRNNVEKIEVIRGPASMIYGSNAIGGAINLITKKQKTPGMSNHSMITFGSYNTSIISENFGYSNKKFNFSMSVDHAETDGHRVDADDNFNSNSIYGQLSYALTPAYNLSFDANYTDSRFYDPGMESAPKEDNYYDYLRTRAALTLENKFGDTEGAAKVFYNFGKHSFFDSWYSVDDFKGVSVYQSTKFFGDNIFTGGFEFKNYGGRAESDSTPALRGLNKWYDVNEAEAYGIININVQTLNISAGLRLTNNSIYGSDYTPQYGFTYNASSSTTIKGNVGKAFRSPTVVDFFLFPVASDSLEPEEVWSYEAGIQNTFFNEAVKTELTLFYLDALNIIQVLPSANGFRKVNSGSFNNKGVEFILNVNPQTFLSAFFNYTYLKTSIDLPFAPEHKANLHMECNFKYISVSADIQAVDNLFISSSLKENYTTVGVSAAFKFSQKFSLFVKGTNLSDEKYYVENGYPSPGRVIFAGVKLAFDKL